MPWYNEQPPDTPFDTPAARKAAALFEKHGRTAFFILRNWKLILLGFKVVIYGVPILLVLAFCAAPMMMARNVTLSDAEPFLAALQAGDLQAAADLSQDGSDLALALEAGEFAQIATLTDLEWENFLRKGSRGGTRYTQVRATALVPHAPSCEVTLHLRLTEGLPSHMAMEPTCTRSGEDAGLTQAAPPDPENW